MYRAHQTRRSSRPVLVGMALSLGLLVAAAPSSAYIVYSHRGFDGSLIVMNDDGSSPHALVGASDLGASEAPANPFVDPRGDIVVFESQGAIWELDHGSLFNVTTGARTSETQSGSASTGNSEPEAGGDGRVVWQHEFSVTGGGWSVGDMRIWSTSLAGGGGITELARWCDSDANNKQADPAPQPSSGAVAYVGCSETGYVPEPYTDWFLDMTSLPTGEHLASTREAWITDPSWSSDGAKIVVVVEDMGTFESSIYVVDAAGTDPAREILAPQPGSVTSPRFAGPDTIVFAYAAGGDSDIYSLPPSCNACPLSSAVRLTATGSDTEPAWTGQPVTPSAAHQPDSDRDGVVDAQDRCPTIAAATADGCPVAPEADGDHDGVPDSRDQCPTVPGTSANGCPAQVRDTVAPVISDFKLTPSTFRAARRGASIAATAGTTITDRLTEAATTRFSVSRLLPGRRVGGKCKPATRGNSRAKRCIRLVPVRGGFAHTCGNGLNRMRFTGRVGGRALRPGRYELRATARDASGNVSAPVRRGFRVKR